MEADKSSKQTKKVLVLTYSQTGQQTRIIESILGPLRDDDDIQVTVETLAPETPYPFPWPFLRFFEIFPECVYLDPPPMKPYSFDPSEDYDLIILSYQVWFLSPSLPATAFLQSPQGRTVLKDKPVITVIGCRNMWLSAQETVKGFLKDLEATLLDNVVLIDESPPSTTFVTTTRWMLTGKKDQLWGIFPAPGVSDEAIVRARRFGDAIQQGLHSGAVAQKQTLLRGLGAVRVNPSYIDAEKIGTRSFRIWGRLIRAFSKQGQKRRKPLIFLYFCILLTLILTVLPLTILVRLLLKPFRRASFAKQTAYYEEPSGSDQSLVDAKN